MARDFPFPVGDMRGQTYALGITHVGLVLPVAGVGMLSVTLTVADAKRLAVAIEAAVTQAENVLPTGLGESVAVLLGVKVSRFFDDAPRAAGIGRRRGRKSS